ncbi:hypothetical protein QBC42DRAFT_76965 [Cladorrhinum samala]|uniref:UspA domain-containing protein n=1 Tax=Cladorrhinum samala TaxID=585594 RepID=A0AAV9HSX5_9PEZI|nr:hypothetical protein QBC42DRAFT_76965 [Cladorrhinum samala]
MLDVGDAPPSRPIRSMLDVDTTPPGAKQVLSTPSSPTESSSRGLGSVSNAHPRSMSDAAAKPADFGPRASARHDATLGGYQFSGIITNNAGQALPKRNTQGGKRAMAEVMRGNDVTGLVLPGDRGRHSVSGPAYKKNAGNKSKSPQNRLGIRSHSPHTPLLGRQMSPAGRAILESNNQPIDLENAYRRLSDAALLRSGGSLAELTRRKKSDEASNNGRLTRDYLGPNGELLIEESSEDDVPSSSEEDDRGRKAARTADLKAKPSSASPEATRQARSLLAAAEEERVQVASQQPKEYKYRSLFDDEPSITVTNPQGEKERLKNSKPVIHPNTSFDSPPTGTHTPMYTDTEEDLTDIKRAQKLSFATTQIISHPEANRTIQIITRGDYAKLVQDAEEEHRPPRKYLVATDMSDESTHALEWAIGTVLRDGDTLLCIYCVDEEAGIALGDSDPVVPDKEQAAAINAIASSKTPSTPGGTTLPLRPSPLGLGQGQQSAASEGSLQSSSVPPSANERSKLEEERSRAVKDISNRAQKLLRKTRLQVRVIVEVLHCKNPKHLITEVIDLVNPTLVILGSRGRSALKGVILGSFSNYLVTKSSVPVMVARKKLRKQSKYKKLAAHHQQVNNINNPAARSLANAKID